MLNKIYDDGIPNKFERIDDLAYIDGWEKNSAGKYHKLTKDGLIVNDVTGAIVTGKQIGRAHV